MYRLLASALVLTLGLSIAQADDKKDEKQPDKAQTPKDIFQELVKKFRDIKDPKERQVLFTTYGQKLVDFAKANSKEDSALEALGMVFRIPSSKDKDNPKQQAIAILTTNHVKNPKIGLVVNSLSEDDPGTLGLLKGILKSNPDAKVKASACTRLIEIKEDALGEALRLKADEKERATYDKEKGKGAAEKVIQGYEATVKEVAELVKMLRSEYKQHASGLYIGDKMPDLASEDLEGKKVKLSDHKDKVVVLDVWATWCPPCRAMIPHERELVKRLKDKPFALVSVSFDEKKETLTEFLEKNPMPWTHWFNGKTGSLNKELNIRFFPTIFVLDHKGVIRFKGVRGKAMDAAVETLLAELEEQKKAKTE